MGPSHAADRGGLVVPAGAPSLPEVSPPLSLTSAIITLRDEQGRPAPARRREPVGLGIPFARGMVRDLASCHLTDRDGGAVDVQWRVLEHWPDGSVRWALADWCADTTGAHEARYVLRVGGDATRPAHPAPVLRVQHGDQGVVVDTGVATFRMTAGAALPFAEVTSAGTPCLDAALSALTVTDADGGVHPCVSTHLSIEEQGPLRVAVRADAHAVGLEPLRIAVRAEFFAGSATTRLSISLLNPRRARHDGGIWVLGDPGSLLFRECAITVGLRGDAPTTASVSLEIGDDLQAIGTAFDLRQESSGGPAWNSPNHVNRDGALPQGRRGYHLSSGGNELKTGLRATPVGRVAATTGSLTVAVPHFWQNFPKALAVEGRRLRVSLFPGSADVHELQGGERKTHTVVVAFGEDRVSQPALDWARNRLVPCLAPEWYAHAEPSLLLPLGESLAETEAVFDALVRRGVEGPESFAAKAERVDEYGWRNFGDLFADHETAGDAGRGVVISHYNNQYDAVAGFALQFMRSGDVRWRQSMLDLAAHVCDVDVYHTSEDKSAFNGGLFWHTAHYKDAATSTHRSYPRLPGVVGGGPSNEHCYSHGLLLHHLMTGDPASREAVLGLARWMLDADDGRTTVFRWLASGDTGLASSTAQTDYHGPGRGAGNAILAMLNADRLDPAGPWLAKAEALVRRCINPADDIDSRHLLDAELRWSYTVFLQTLLRYIERKFELGQRDDMQAYAAASLLAYARWMRVHEYPYLDKPEILEFPNETWSAQDLRKAEVLYGASQLSSGDEAEALRTRGDFFFDHAVRALADSPTSSLTRPMVLMLSQGMRARGARDRRRPWRSLGPVDVAGRAFAPPVAFEPQKTRAIRRARRIALIGAVLAVLALVATAWLVVRALS